MSRPRLEITNHAIRRWQQRIESVSEQEALSAILAALSTAKERHFHPYKLKKRTFYIPTTKAMFVGTRGKIVTVLERGQSIYDNFEVELEDALLAANGQINAGEIGG